MEFLNPENHSWFADVVTSYFQSTFLAVPEIDADLLDFLGKSKNPERLQNLNKRISGTLEYKSPKKKTGFYEKKAFEKKKIDPEDIISKLILYHLFF